MSLQDPPGTCLLIVLRARKLITSEEDSLLQTPAVKTLGPRAQLAYLRTNRRSGLFITLFAGGPRLLLLAGAFVTLLAFSVCGRLPPEAGILLALGVLVLLISLVPGCLRRSKILRQPLPEYLELM